MNINHFNGWIYVNATKSLFNCFSLLIDKTLPMFYMDYTYTSTIHVSLGINTEKS